jgi:hypothetical protein
MKHSIESVIIFVAFHIFISCHAENKTQKRTILSRMIEFEGNINIGALVSQSIDDPYFEQGRQMAYAYDMFVE